MGRLQDAADDAVIARSGVFDFAWITEQGRDRDGDLIDRRILVDRGGRCVAHLNVPQVDEKKYQCVMLIGNLRDDDAYHYFIDLKPAQAYCEATARDIIRKETRRVKVRSRYRARQKVPQ